MKEQYEGEENDLPFVKNDLRDSPATMGKPLDTADAPGHADSEMAEEGLPPRDQAETPGTNKARAAS